MKIYADVNARAAMRRWRDILLSKHLPGNANLVSLSHRIFVAENTIALKKNMVENISFAKKVSKD